MRNNRGETLVETVVAFAVLLLLLAMLATVLQAAARMNARATQRLALLEADCTLVEQNMGVYAADEADAVQGDTLTLTPKDNASLQPIAIGLDVRSGETLHYFGTAATGGGG